MGPNSAPLLASRYNSISMGAQAEADAQEQAAKAIQVANEKKIAMGGAAG